MGKNVFYSLMAKGKKTRFVGFAFTLIFTSCLHQTRTTVFENVNRGYFFYQVEKNKKISYIFGSIHIVREQDKKLPKSVWDAFSKSKSLALEVPLESQQANTWKKFSDYILKTPSKYFAKN